MLPLAVVGQGFDSTIQKDDADEKNDENDSEHGKNNQKQIRLLRKIVVYSLIEIVVQSIIPVETFNSRLERA